MRRKLLTPREVPRIMPRSRLWPFAACGGAGLWLGEVEGVVADVGGLLVTTETMVVVSSSAEECPSGPMMSVVKMAVEVEEKRVLGVDDVELELAVELDAGVGGDIEAGVEAKDDVADDEVLADAGETADQEVLEGGGLKKGSVSNATAKPKDIVNFAALTDLLVQQLPSGMP